MIVFARTRHVYSSYTDFWRLVEASGFDTCYVDEIDLADDTKTYIFTPINGEVMPRLPAWKGRKCRIIWWNLERPEDETLPSSLTSVRGSIDAVWVSDRAYAALHHELTYVLLAGHKDFGARFIDKHHDVVHLAYIHGRRRAILDAILRRGVKIAPEAYGREAQDRIVARSHLMLNLHQYDEMFIVAPIRFAVAASYAIPIISEPYADHLAANLTIAQSPPGELAERVEVLLRDKDRLRSRGAFLFERLCLSTDFGLQVRHAARHG